MGENKEIITGSDFKRMIAGAYSAFLLEYENINALQKASFSGEKYPGHNLLRTMGAAAIALKNNDNKGIGAVSSMVSNCAVLGARGNSGVVLAQIFRGLAKGLAGKYEVNSSVFGKAFQYGILYAHRISSGNTEHPMIVIAKAVAKGAYKAVRANRPISEILAAAITAGDDALEREKIAQRRIEVGAKALMVLLEGCQAGLDGNFVSPAVVFSSGTTTTHTVPNPTEDIVHPYCVQMRIRNCKVGLLEVKEILGKYGNMLVIKKKMHDVFIHLHTQSAGVLADQIIGWGSSYEMRVDNMADLHKPLILAKPIKDICILAIVNDEKIAEQVEQYGAMPIIVDKDKGLAVGNFVNTVHSDIAKRYIILSNDSSLRLMLYQTKRLLGKRIQIIYSENTMQQLAALQVYDSEESWENNIKKMENIIKKK